MKKGIILDVNERFLTLLTPEGEFLKVKKTMEHYEIGEEISIPTKENNWLPFLTFLNSFKVKTVTSVTVAFVLAFIFLIPSKQDDVYAYMSIDINPSIELGVNEDLKVVEMISYNEKGDQILKELNDWKMKDMKKVTFQILGSLKEKGYFLKQNEIVIGTVHTGEVIKKSDEKLEKVIDELEKDLIEDETNVIEVEATAKDRERAVEAGITTGKLISEQQRVIKEPKTVKERKRSVQDKVKFKEEKKSQKEKKQNEKLEKIEKEKPQQKKNDPNMKGQKENSKKPKKEEKIKEEKPKKDNPNKGNPNKESRENVKKNEKENQGKNKGSSHPSKESKDE